MERDTAIPTLPTRDIEETVTFYSRLGFSVLYQETEPEPYLILARGDLEIHFFFLPGLDPSTAHSGCYIRVADADAYFEEFSKLGIPDEGIPQMSELENKPWGMLEFHIIDPSGNLLRFGKETEPPLI